MKYIKIAIAAIAIISTASSCEKKHPTCGSNVVKYKLNGSDRKSEGSFSNWGQYGNSINYKSTKDLFFINGASSTNNSLHITVHKSTLPKCGLLKIDSFNYFKLVVESAQYFNINNNLVIDITENSNKVLAGKFSGKLYQLAFGNNQIVDSVEITDGYFDMPKP